nr:hypothetical protein [Neisseria mucosa]
MRTGHRFADQWCFNTQPPEGGWHWATSRQILLPSFNTQPPEDGWTDELNRLLAQRDVSTHSRPKAAVCVRVADMVVYKFQHTAARRRLGALKAVLSWIPVSTHSRPKAADWTVSLYF